ncbi:MAG: hypothetical protein ABSC03_10720 [Verrucomicrobiota bacterium]|jgi:hypothetical protein
MPGEPNHNLERRLQDYAAARRQQAGGPFTVPPDTRRAVQQEVERLAGGRTSPGARLPWWSLFSVRLAALAGTVAVLAIAGVAWWQWDHQRPAELAKVSEPAARKRLGAPSEQLEERQRALDRSGVSPATNSLLASNDRTVAKPAREALVLADAFRTNATTASAALAVSSVEALNRDKDKAAVASPAAYGVPMAAPAVPAPESGTAMRYGLARRPAAGLKEESLGEPQVASAPAATIRDEGGAGGVRVEAEANGSNRDLRFAPTSPAAAATDTRPTRLASRAIAESKKSPELAEERVPSAGRVAGIAGGAAQANSDLAVAVPALQPSDSTVLGAVELRMMLNDQPAEIRQQFQNQLARPALRRNYNSPPRPAVLREFQIATTGNRLQVTDADGSVYVGTIVPATQLGQPELVAQTVAGQENKLGRDANAPGYAPAGAFGGAFGQANQANTQANTAPSSNGNYAYFARGGLPGTEWLVNFTGTNRSLNQKVAFEGCWVMTNADALQNSVAANNQMVQSGATNSVLRGQALLGDRTRLEINATPMPNR